MAEGVLLNIVAGLVANVATELIKKIKVSLRVKDELRKLNDTLSIIQAVLLDAEEKKEIDNQVKVWLDRLEDVVYDADNLLDEFRYQHLRRKVLFSKKKARKVRIFFSRSSNQLIFRYKMAKKIKKIRQTLDEIKADQVFSQLVKRDGEVTHVPSPMSWRETHSFITNDEVIGRDDDKKKIIDFLLDNGSETEESVSIVSLVGFGGLGKTALAQLVFNDELVKKHFEKQMYWVCVSDSFELRSLLGKIIIAAKKSGLDQAISLEGLQNSVREEIKDKKYLLVLDDVWNEDVNKWNELKTFLKLGRKGSKVLITSRSRTVAHIVNSTKTHVLGGLDEHKSWVLFERVVFGGRSYEPTAQSHRLLEIGKSIVKKCGGVPLVIRTVGGLLLSNSDSLHNLERELIYFREVDIQRGSDVLATLKLSYNILPSHLKHCFAYCSLFPKDHKIDVRQLIKLWIAQGFIKDDGNRKLEEIGDKYVRILLSRCFFQEAEIDELFETIKYCKMHDLMHDLASSVAGKSIKILDENILGELERYTNSNRSDRDGKNVVEKVCHVYVDLETYRRFQIPTMLFEQKKMRTFLLPESNGLSSSDCDGILSNFKLLRALCLKTNEETLPDSLGTLKHLRYLDLSRNYHSVQELPNSIGELYNLETLILFACHRLACLPDSLGNLKNLRYLDLSFNEFKELPNSITGLSNLETLILDSCRSLIKLPNSLGNLNQLRYLDLSHNEFKELPNSITGLSNLETLFLSHCGSLVSFPAGIQNLTKLRHLKIDDCYGLTHMPCGIGGLTSLQTLDVFLVADKKSSESGGLGELLNLNNLRGHLTFKFESAENTFELAAAQYLKDKEYLESLFFRFPAQETTVNAKEAFECFEPHQYIKAIEVNDYPGETFPDWLSFLANLVRLTLFRCENCKYLPPLHHLSSLRELSLHSMSALEYVSKWDSDWNRGDCLSTSSKSLFPSLVTLCIQECANLKGWWGSDDSGEALIEPQHPSFLKLSEVIIYCCPLLASMPLFPTLEKLTISAWHSCGLSSDFTKWPSLLEWISNLKSLQQLEFSYSSNLTSLTEQTFGLPSLTDLIIKRCIKLTSIPNGIGNLSTLTNLSIRGCWSLSSLPDGISSLSSLTHLTIQECMELTSIPEGIGNLTSLTHLRIDGCTSLTSIPDGVDNLPSLENVNGESCAELGMTVADYLRWKCTWNSAPIL